MGLGSYGQEHNYPISLVLAVDAAVLCCCFESEFFGAMVPSEAWELR